MTAPATSRSAWAPLRHRLFRAIWLASLLSNLGTWMQNTAAAWMMTSLSALVPSWLEHLRQHERSTEADRRVEEAVAEFLTQGRPTVTHFVGVRD